MSHLLSNFIEQHALTDHLLPAPQIEGFITAMAAAPYPLNPTEWLSFFWHNQEKAPFSSNMQLEEFAQVVANVWNHQRQALLDNTWRWPESCPAPEKSEDLADQNTLNQATRQYCEGLLQGWGVVLEDWHTLMPEDSSEGALLSGVLMAIGILFDPATAIAAVEQQGSAETDLAQFQEIYHSIPTMLCGLTIHASQCVA